MEKPYFYHRFKVEMPIRHGFYESFVSFMKSFCDQRDIRIEWVQTIELTGYSSVTFVLRGDYMIPSTLVTLGMLWESEMQNILAE